MDVWIEACPNPVGLLERADDGSLTFTYAGDVPKDGRLSLSMPIRKEPYQDAECRGYFANLLFEGPQLDTILESFKLKRGDTGALLWHLGGDCPGAVSVTPEGSGPGKTPGRFPQDYDLLSAERLQEIAVSLHLHRRLPDTQRNPSPLAGVQGKIAIVHHDGKVYLPKAGSKAPTTHILKVSPVSDPDITRNELSLLMIADACHLPIAACQGMEFLANGRQVNAILSTRFDRRIDISKDEGLISRIHAEDFCQALGLAPSLKYQRDSVNPEHMFSASAVAKISSMATVPAQFQRGFLDQCLFNILVGNSDNHGKNGSVLHQAGEIRLAPLYDVVPVFMDKTVTHQLAFRHGMAEFAEDLTQDSLKGLLIDLGFQKPQMVRVLRQIGSMARTISKAAPDLARKDLVDALYAQGLVLQEALSLDFELQKRDFYDRLVRDDWAGRGGWGGFS